ncbi:urate oxidase [Streptomyces sp. B1866]|uniref:factor-independent urate hydroxylase n=1 Tax=Streptomyces sp. B1866 TaxID=3075431 RepID=UPI0028901275|nr:urate oxidase [Streptomyces sp. B1866]MDT3400177.1 urate oxidase [Streptomyces sp. B1866]
MVNTTDPAAVPSPPAGRAVLGQNQYGKAETRVVRVTRDGRTHRVRDLNVSIALTGAMDEVHLSGSNANVLPTDTAKNTVYAFARRHGVASPEDFGALLARHFVTSQEAVTTARVRLAEYAWERIGSAQDGTGHSFVRAGRETRTAQVGYDGERFEVVSGLTGLTVMNTTDSEFRGFVTDPYTTLRETGDRVLATDVTARWRAAWDGAAGQPAPDWDRGYAEVREDLLRAFAGTYSRSLQQTLYAMGARVVEARPWVEEIRLSLPNKHHFLVDLEPFGLTNDNEVYHAADRPYGLIEATVLREGTRPRIPTD